MESKWKAVIQYFCSEITALTKSTDSIWRSNSVVISHGSGKIKPGSSCDQAQLDSIAGQTTPQVENQAGEAPDNGDVHGRNIVPDRIVGTIDIDSLGSHFSQALRSSLPLFD